MSCYRHLSDTTQKELAQPNPQIGEDRRSDYNGGVLMFFGVLHERPADIEGTKSAKGNYLGWRNLRRRVGNLGTPFRPGGLKMLRILNRPAS